MAKSNRKNTIKNVSSFSFLFISKALWISLAKKNYSDLILISTNRRLKQCCHRKAEEGFMIDGPGQKALN